MTAKPTVWILGDQLDPAHPALAHASPNDVRVLFIESAALIGSRRWHRQRDRAEVRARVGEVLQGLSRGEIGREQLAVATRVSYVRARDVDVPREAAARAESAHVQGAGRRDRP